MTKQSSFPSLISLFALVIFSLILTILFLTLNIFSLRKTIQQKETQISALNSKSAQQPRDPFVDYALNLNKYDSKGAKPLLYKCFDRKPPEKMSQADQFWYNAANHNPVIPENDKNINFIQNNLKEKNTSADKICLSPITSDYLVIYRYQYEKGKYKDFAELYRFKNNRDSFSYDAYPISNDFAFFKIVLWLDNGDLVYDPIGYNDYHTVYVFTANNKDILLEFCSVDYENNSMTAGFTCKNFNNISNSSNYLPNSVLDEFVGRTTF